MKLGGRGTEILTDCSTIVFYCEQITVNASYKGHPSCEDFNKYIQHTFPMDQVLWAMLGTPGGNISIP